MVKFEALKMVSKSGSGSVNMGNFKLRIVF
jgi:hypothetical protein